MQIWIIVYTLKGQQVGRFYGALSILRQPGDIDIWVKGGMEKVVDYVQGIAPTNSMSHQHVHFNIFDDISVEMHYIAAEIHCPWYNNTLKSYLDVNSNFDLLLDDCGLKGIFVPSIEFNIVHLIAHAFRHLFGEGMNLRQLMDLYFVLRAWSAEESEKDKILLTLKSCGMESFTEG